MYLSTSLNFQILPRTLLGNFDLIISPANHFKRFSLCNFNKPFALAPVTFPSIGLRESKRASYLYLNERLSYFYLNKRLCRLPIQGFLTLLLLGPPNPSPTAHCPAHHQTRPNLSLATTHSTSPWPAFTPSPPLNMNGVCASIT